jgi:hypothetical protein
MSRGSRSPGAARNGRARVLNRQLEERTMALPKRVENLVAAARNTLARESFLFWRRCPNQIRRSGSFLSSARRATSGIRSTLSISA